MGNCWMVGIGVGDYTFYFFLLSNDTFLALLRSHLGFKFKALESRWSTSCVRTVCPKLSTNLEQTVNNL
jgi:hypothetical protein